MRFTLLLPHGMRYPSLCLQVRMKIRGCPLGDDLVGNYAIQKPFELGPKLSNLALRITMGRWVDELKDGVNFSMPMFRAVMFCSRYVSATGNSKNNTFPLPMCIRHGIFSNQTHVHAHIPTPNNLSAST